MANPPQNDPSQLFLWGRIRAWARLLFRRDTPWKVRLILASAIIYLLSPFDFVPDWIAGFGLLDDFTVVTLLVAWAIKVAGTAQQKK